MIACADTPALRAGRSVPGRSTGLEV
jgi:hypothetical protein